MPDAATIGVLRDVVTLTLLALALGGIAYGFIRRAALLTAWSNGGNVLSRLYSPADIVFALLLLSPYLLGLLMADPSAKPTAEAKSDHIGAASVLAQIVLVLGEAVMILIYLRYVRGYDVSELFGVRNLRFGKVLGTALGAIAPTFLVVVLVNMGASELLKGIWPDASPQAIVQAFETTGSVPVRLLMVFAAVVAAPLTEELLFRGLVYGVCKRYTDGWFAAIASSLLFATVHLHVGSFLPLFSLALILVAVYELTGCLLVPMLIHAMFNGFMLLAMAFGAE